jgi:hypothetical protein
MQGIGRSAAADASCSHPALTSHHDIARRFGISTRMVEKGIEAGAG